MLTSARVVDFEDYDGSLPVDRWPFAFGSASAKAFWYGAHEAERMFGIVAGAASERALGQFGALRPPVEMGGVMISFDCVDASSLRGVTIEFEDSRRGNVALVQGPWRDFLPARRRTSPYPPWRIRAGS